MSALRNVLIVEDEILIAAMVQEAIEQLGCRVVGPAHSLFQAADVVATESIDFAVIDIDLEGISSAPIAEELHRRNVPFLFTTGYDQGDIDKTYRCPVITKPFDPSYLQGVVAGMLNLKMPDQ